MGSDEYVVDIGQHRDNLEMDCEARGDEKKYQLNSLVPNDHCIGQYYATSKWPMMSTLVTFGRL